MIVLPQTLQRVVRLIKNYGHKILYLEYISDSQKLTDFKNTVWLDLIDAQNFLAHIK